MKNLKVLITCGPTWVAIDQVRVISNRSTGEMGHLIAQEFLLQKAQVTLVEGPVTDPWGSKKVKVIKYHFFDELQKILREQVARYDVIIHAAAVSDFKVAKAFKSKLSSSRLLSLELVPTAKLINSIKAKAPKALLVGFKLEPKLKIDNIVGITESLFTKAHCDLVVANTLKGGYKGFIIDKKENVLAKADTKKKLAKTLVNLLYGRPRSSC